MPDPTNDLNIVPPATDDANFGAAAADPAPAPAADPAPAEDPTKSLMDAISTLNTGLQELTEKVNGLQSAAPAPAATGAPAAGDGTDDGGEPWKPGTWDDVVTKAREEAQAVLDAAEHKRRAEQQEQDAKRKEVDDMLDTQLADLEKANKLAPIVNNDDPNDIGRQQRAELIGYAIKLDTTNLTGVADALETYHKAGQQFDYRTGTFVAIDPNADSKMAPVGSSGRSTGATANPTDAERAKLIRGSRDLDDLIDKVGSGKA